MTSNKVYFVLLTLVMVSYCQITDLLAFLKEAKKKDEIFDKFCPEGEENCGSSVSFTNRRAFQLDS